VLTNKHTNKQTPLKTFNALRRATTMGNNFVSHVTTALVLDNCSSLFNASMTLTLNLISD